MILTPYVGAWRGIRATYKVPEVSKTLGQRNTQKNMVGVWNVHKWDPSVMILFFNKINYDDADDDDDDDDVDDDGVGDCLPFPIAPRGRK